MQICVKSNNNINSLSTNATLYYCSYSVNVTNSSKRVFNVQEFLLCFQEIVKHQE